ncbi:MAG: FadR family transcriptional regulator [Deltaproteobacteria bacterium]|nr:FadR family transcriptional regulator [Deltaproteobacteria bacterium]
MITFKPVENKRIFELVTDEIREAIFFGSLKPGDRLPSERELSRQMSVKQGVDGGIFVKEPDGTNFTRSFSDLLRLGHIDIEELTEARLLIEKDVIDLVTRKAEQRDFEPLDQIITTGFAKLQRGEKIRKENFQFHIVLAELSRNPIFVMIVNAIVPIIAVFVEMLNPPLAHSRSILESHRDILEEIKRGNAAAAKEKLDEHILYFSKEFKKLMPLKGVRFEEAMKKIAEFRR